jgi:hypothetical protein
LFVDDELIAVANLWIADGYTANLGDLGYEISWVRDQNQVASVER